MQIHFIFCQRKIPASCQFSRSSPSPTPSVLIITASKVILLQIAQLQDQHFRKSTRPGVDKVKPKVWFKYSLQIDYTVDLNFLPSKSKIDNVFTEHVGLLHVLPLTVHLRFFCWTSRGDHSEPFLLFDFYCGTPPSCLKVIGGVGCRWPP